MSFYMGCGVVLTQGDGYVLVQETLSHKRGFYNLPAGTLEVNEDLLACAVREAEEETGIKIVLEHFVGVYQCVLADGNNVVLFIFATSIESDAVFHSEEHVVIEVLSYDDVVAYDKAGKLRSPIVRKSIEDYRAGQKYPLSTVQAWHLDALSTITV
jgi:phosphatase NudJ